MFSSSLGKGEVGDRCLIDADTFSDGNIRYYEYENDALHPLAEYKSSEPREPLIAACPQSSLICLERGMTLLPRRALDVSQNEIARGFKLAGGAIEPLSFIVPRKAESFQSEYVNGLSFGLR